MSFMKDFSFMDVLSGPIGGALIGAVVYFSPLSQNGVMYVAGQAAAAAYGINLVHSASDQTAALKSAGLTGAAAAAGFMGAPYASLDPILGAAIIAPAAFVMLKM